MNINPNNIDLIISAVQEALNILIQVLSEVALSGRSNVGKSSFINTSMIGRKIWLARRNNQAKHKTLNFFNIDDQLIFVDVPGYVYAKVSKSQREIW